MADRDALGWRGKFAVLMPSTNTIVEPDFYRMTVPGVTAHCSRIHIRDMSLDSDDAFERLLEGIRQEIGSAVERAVTLEPDYMVMGMSAETFWEGVEGNRRFKKQIQDLSGARRRHGGRGLRAHPGQFQRQAHRRVHAVPARRRRQRRPLLQRARLRGRSGQGAALPDGRGHRGGAGGGRFGRRCWR